MRQNGKLLVGLVGLLLMAGLWAAGFGLGTADLNADEAAELGYLPAIFKPQNTSTPEATLTPSPTPEATATPSPTPEPVAGLINGSFEDEDWIDLDQQKQQPVGWELTWVEPGQPIYDSNGQDIATGSSESVHKYFEQLPPNERPGGPDALILEGDYTFKNFKKDTIWATQMSQTVALPAGSQWLISVPMQLHVDARSGSPWDAEASLWVNDFGYWSNIENLGDRRWCNFLIQFTVPEAGEARFDIRFKSKFLMTHNFFTDDVRLVPKAEGDPHPGLPVCAPNSTLHRYRGQP